MPQIINNLDIRYLDLILDMTADGKLAFLIADDNICYGANYPFSHVVIEDRITNEHSIGTIFQLIGRAGRVGQSWVAYAHVGDVTTKRIMNYINGSESSGVSLEAENLNKCFSKVKEESAKQELKNNNIIKLSEVVHNSHKKNSPKLIEEVEPVKPIQKDKPKIPEEGKTEVAEPIVFEAVESWEDLVIPKTDLYIPPNRRT